MPQILLSVIGMAGSAGAAFLGSWLGLRRFRSERVWESKWRVYQALSGALNDIYEQFECLLEARMAERIVPEEKQKLLEEAADKAWVQVRKHARVGSLILSERASAALARFLAEAERGRAAADYGDYLERQGAAVMEALRQFNAAARADLADTGRT